MSADAQSSEDDLRFPGAGVRSSCEVAYLGISDWTRSSSPRAGCILHCQPIPPAPLLSYKSLDYSWVISHCFLPHRSFAYVVWILVWAFKEFLSEGTQISPNLYVFLCFFFFSFLVWLFWFVFCYYTLVAYLYSSERQEDCGSRWEGRRERTGKSGGGELQADYILWKKANFNLKSLEDDYWSDLIPWWQLSWAVALPVYNSCCSIGHILLLKDVLWERTKSNPISTLQFTWAVALDTEWTHKKRQLKHQRVSQQCF